MVFGGPYIVVSLVLSLEAFGVIHELSNFDHVLGVVSQTRVSAGNRTHDPHANSLAHSPLDYQGT